MFSLSSDYTRQVTSPQAFRGDWMKIRKRRTQTAGVDAPCVPRTTCEPTDAYCLRPYWRLRRPSTSSPPIPPARSRASTTPAIRPPPTATLSRTSPARRPGHSGLRRANAELRRTHAGQSEDSESAARHVSAGHHRERREEQRGYGDDAVARDGRFRFELP